MTDIRDRMLAILKEPDRYSDADLNARHRLKRLCAEIAEIPVWLEIEAPGTGPFTRQDSAIKQLRAAILAIGDDNAQAS